MNKSQVEFMNLRYDFTAEELLQMGTALVDTTMEIDRVTQEKKNAVQMYTGRISKLQTEFDEIVVNLHNRFIMRDMAVRKIKNYSTGRFEYYSVDNYDLVHTQAFTAKDLQRDIEELYEDVPFSTGEPVPTDNGTLDTNPARYERLLRELNFWQDQLKKLSESEEYETIDERIDAGVEIGGKIEALKIALKEMDVKPETDEQTAKYNGEENEADQTDDNDRGEAERGNDSDGGPGEGEDAKKDGGPETDNAGTGSAETTTPAESGTGTQAGGAVDQTDGGNEKHPDLKEPGPITRPARKKKNKGGHEGTDSRNE